MSGGEDRPDLHHTPDTGLQLHRVSALQHCSTQGNSGGRGSFIPLSVSKCQIFRFQPEPKIIAPCAGAQTTRLLSHTLAAQHSQHSTASQD